MMEKDGKKIMMMEKGGKTGVSCEKLHLKNLKSVLKKQKKRIIYNKFQSGF